MKIVAHLVNGKTRTGAISSIKRIINNFSDPYVKLIYLCYGNSPNLIISNENRSDFIDLKFSFFLGDFVSGKRRAKSLMLMLIYFFIDIIKLLKYCKINKVDIIHLHYFSDIFQFSFLRIFNIKIVSHVRAIVNKKLFYGIPFFVFKRIIYSCSNKIIGISQASIEALEKPNSKKNIIIYNGLEGLNKTENIALEEKTNGYFIIGSVIRFAELKGIFLFIETFFRFYKSYPNANVKFLLVAKSVDVESTKIKEDFFNEIRNRGLSDKLIYFEEFPNYSYIMPYLDILFHTTQQREGFGNVVLEAHWFGKPVVSTPCLGVNDIIDIDKSGFLLADSNSSDEAVAFFEKLISSRALYIEMSERSFEIAHSLHFNISYSMDRLKTLYKAL